MSQEKQETLFIVTCCDCGIDFGFPLKVKDGWQRNEKSFYCPNGHGIKFLKPSTEAEQLKEEVKSLKEKITALETDQANKAKRIEELETELAIWRPRQEAAS